MPTLGSTPSTAISRRQFVKTTGVAASALTLGAPAFVRGQNLNNRLNIAVIGAGGKGASDTDSCSSENIVGLCDVDRTTLDKRGEKYPGARKFQDFRKMLEEMKEIDAVIVSTPDHLHATASLMAMRMGKHVYCQKPLTHSVYEARLMRKVAAERKVATQMGNQGSATDGLRRAIEVIQSGAIGAVRQVHVWSNRPVWPQGHDRPAETHPVPDHLNWDLWLGPAPFRPFNKDAYAPFKWRGWQDFGTGALGDMACHTANLPFRALELGYPDKVSATSTGINKETYPTSSRIQFEFPARKKMPRVAFTWYDGGDKPSMDYASEVVELIGKQKDKDGKPLPKQLPGSGCLLIGDRGKLFSPDDYGSQYYLLPENRFVGYVGPAQTIPKSIGHYKEWLEACKGGKPAYSNFDIAAYLTEIILLGCVALRTGKPIQWDGPNMRAKNAPEAAQYVHQEYRKGWEI